MSDKETIEEAVPRKRCIFHKWCDSALFMETCAKCGWHRQFTGFAFVLYPPAQLHESEKRSS